MLVKLTPVGQGSSLYLNVARFFSMPVFIRHPWQLKTVVFLYWCLNHAVLLVQQFIIHQKIEYFQQPLVPGGRK
jgi:membrane protein insertase Oxa1/YidC/SpoIIIJ